MLPLDEEIQHTETLRTTGEELSAVQVQAVDQAVDKMTAADRNLIARCSQKLREQAWAHEQSADPRDGPSKDKGKGVDPRNWGNLEFSDSEEMNPAAQAQVFENWKKLQREQREQRARLDHHQSRRNPHVEEPLPVGAPPVQNVNEDILRELKALRAETAELRNTQESKQPKRKHARIQLPQADPISVSQGVASERQRRDPTKNHATYLHPSQQLPPDSYLGRALGPLPRTCPVIPDGSDDPKSSSEDDGYNPSSSESGESLESSNTYRS
ncbi:hypothetical protein PC9H_010451 [Pleurotus ostreatus]|uniref:Uncharacterized protein n=2 Tax=Pleurotus TaxID=5320 RepID=A0A8H7DPR3_PLEOS|nr:uncharacterized protein PC9H_010451 [Pleurotus ostreatus]KAF7422295.1 hypothetical protein PC9H_010451 [Pleurotus ostreatus]KAG9227806.1 hypothetical protein CCMSSC00406_0000548 [Pleurotus cornucopiae]KAJ8691895.1 hypothetical protein PTI98_011414 [Pleurotus ostreatus]